MKLLRVAFLTGLSVAMTEMVLQAQTITGSARMNVNKWDIPLTTRGDLWWDAGGGHAKFSPQGIATPGNMGAIAALWIGGYDSNHSLRVNGHIDHSSQLLFWPGPLPQTGGIDSATTSRWDRIWTVSQAQINGFRALSTHTVSNTIPEILEWPGKNNPHAKGKAGNAITVTGDMAPFVDVNNDGNYNPLDGDYPRLKGDLMAWWVFNDNGPAVGTTDPINVEVHAMAYGYARNTAADNIVFYEMDIHNKGGQIDSFATSIFNDANLGYAEDDFIGFDSSRRMGFVYNGDGFDGQGTSAQPGEFGRNFPKSAITILKSPADAGAVKAPAGAFTYFYNINDPKQGAPADSSRYYYYATGSWRDGTPFVKGCTNYGPGTPYPFAYSDTAANGFNACSCNLNPHDVNYVLSAKTTTFNSNTTKSFHFAVMATDPDTLSGCPVMSYTNLYELADTAEKIYLNPLAPLNTGIANVTKEALQVTLMPNPASDAITLVIADKSMGGDAEILIYDYTGRTVLQQKGNGQQHRFDISRFAAGMYFMQVTQNNKQFTGKFIKQ